MRSIAFVNQSASPAITRAVLEQIATACRMQLIEDYAPFWQSAAPDSLVACMSVDEAPRDAAIITLLDQPDAPDVLGYHFVLPNGQPLGRVFLAPILANGGTLITGANSLSQTFSHETLEMVGDPYVNWWADCGNGLEDAIELGDRVEGDTYNKGGVAVSNFLGPRAFREGIGPFDFMEQLTTPFGLTPGGYAIRRKGGPTGTTHQIFGSHYPEWKKEARERRLHSRAVLRSAS